MSALDVILSAPEVTLPTPNFDAVETRHIEMSKHDPDCPSSWDLARQCVCQPITWINGQPVYATLPNLDTWLDFGPDDAFTDHTERMEMSTR